eukprot:gene11186-13032_t
MKIEGNTIIVTGGASGLGEATARYLHARKANVVLVDMNDELGMELSKELGQDRCLFVHCDITNEDSVKALMTKTIEKFGKLHGVVSCAGIASACKIASNRGAHPLDMFERTVRINLTGTFNVLRLAADVIKKQEPVDGERGVFIMTASIAAFEGQQGQGAYSASKGGVVSMTLPLARELAPLGIRVMTVAPGTF